MSETKGIEQHFSDWFGYVFPFGYGTGDEHFMRALRVFMDELGKDPTIKNPSSYDYRHLEGALTPPVAWFLINDLGKHGVIEYGTSPRFGWLTEQGEALRKFMGDKSVEDLLALTETTEDYCECYPDICNCGPDGFSPVKLCHNPFWIEGRRKR